MELTEKIKNIPTPAYYYNIELLEDTLHSLCRESGKYGYHIHYAIKANANPTLLKLISQYALGADCVSGNEIRQWKLDSRPIASYTPASGKVTQK